MGCKREIEFKMKHEDALKVYRRILIEAVGKLTSLVLGATPRGEWWVSVIESASGNRITFRSEFGFDYWLAQQKDEK